MASTAPITDVHPAASRTDAALFQFETIHVSLETIAAVLGAAGEEVEPGGMSQRGLLLVDAARDLLRHSLAAMSAAVTQAYAERR